MDDANHRLTLVMIRLAAIQHDCGIELDDVIDQLREIRNMTQAKPAE